MTPETKQRIAIIKIKLKLARLEAKEAIAKAMAEDSAKPKYKQSARDAKAEAEYEAYMAEQQSEYEAAIEREAKANEPVITTLKEIMKRHAK